jgi:hypothetical protein
MTDSLWMFDMFQLLETSYLEGSVASDESDLQSAPEADRMGFSITGDSLDA